MDESLKKRILIVTGVFHPVNSPRSLRATELAKCFSTMGHDVVVLTTGNKLDHAEFENKNQIKIINLGEINFKPIMLKGKGLIYLFRRVIARVASLFFAYPEIELYWKVKKMLKNEYGYDLMISIAVPYPIHWGVAASRKENKPIAKIWAADCGDPFMGAENDTVKPPFYFKYFELSYLKKADYITVPISEAINAYYSQFRYKFKVIPQGFSFPQLKNEFNVDRKIPVFIYAGNIISYRHYAIPFFEELKKIKIDFRFIVYTETPDLIKDNVLEIQNKVEIKRYIPRIELINKLYNADFLIHFPYQKNTQRSLKLIDYWYTKKPILHFDNTEEAKSTLGDFLVFDFKNSKPSPPINEFKVEVVCKQFIELCPK